MITSGRLSKKICKNNRLLVRLEFIEFLFIVVTTYGKIFVISSNLNLITIRYRFTFVIHANNKVCFSTAITDRFKFL